MDTRGYFFIDGSYLFSSIERVQKIKKIVGKKLDISLFSQVLMKKWSFYIQRSIRVIFYFKKNDARIKKMLKIQPLSMLNSKNHWQIKECGVPLKTIPDNQLQLLDEKYRDFFPRSEKGLDTKLICDALLLVASGRATDIVLMANDRDYIPMLESAQALGANTYLVSLDSSQKIQDNLLNFADAYLTLDSELDQFFQE